MKKVFILTLGCGEDEDYYEANLCASLDKDKVVDELLRWEKVDAIYPKIQLDFDETEEILYNPIREKWQPYLSGVKKFKKTDDIYHSLSVLQQNRFHRIADKKLYPSFLLGLFQEEMNVIRSYEDIRYIDFLKKNYPEYIDKKDEIKKYKQGAYNIQEVDFIE